MEKSILAAECCGSTLRQEIHGVKTQTLQRMLLVGAVDTRGDQEINSCAINLSDGGESDSIANWMSHARRKRRTSGR